MRTKEKKEDKLEMMPWIFSVVFCYEAKIHVVIVMSYNFENIS